MTRKCTAVWMIVLFVAGWIGGGLAVEHLYESQTMSVAPISPRMQRRALDKELIRVDISAVGAVIGLSERQQQDYVMYIDSAAARYGVPHLLLHALCSVESAYDPTALHPVITVRGHQTRAVGLTGVVWEYHADLLKSEGIATARMELVEPGVSIMAAACIVRTMMFSIIQDYTSQGRTLADTSVFSELVRRYYGAYSTDYKQKMLTKIKDTAGRQWMRKVAQDMLLMVQDSSTVVLSGSSTNYREVPHAVVYREST